MVALSETTKNVVVIMEIGAMSQHILGHKRLVTKRKMEIKALMLEDIFVFNIKRLVGTFDVF
jgi:hypothetical protein